MLGILALGMAIVIIGRGIDLSAVAIMAMSVAWYLQLLNGGTGETWPLRFSHWPACSAIGLLNGFLVAYADVPAIFVTLASGSFVFGYVRSQLITQDAVPVPPGHWVELLGGIRLLDVPVEVFIFAVLALPGVPLPALHQMGPLRLSARATISWRRATSAFRSGR